MNSNFNPNFKTKLFFYSSTYFIIYCFARKKAKDLWFDNNFKDVFSEIFYPTKNRYNEDFYNKELILKIREFVDKSIEIENEIISVNTSNNHTKEMTMKEKNKLVFGLLKNSYLFKDKLDYNNSLSYKILLLKHCENKDYINKRLEIMNRK